MSEETKTEARAHVMVVEDSSVFREMQGLLLRQAGYAVSGHEHPHTALAAAKERKFDLVIIDYELPEMNGHQFMHELRKILPDIAIIFVSGSLTLELAIQLGREGVAGIFNKPANPKTLLEKINETITRTGSRDAAVPGSSSSSPLPAARRGSSAAPFPATPAAPAEPSAGDLAYAPRFFPGHCDAFREFTHRLWKVRDFRAVLLLQGEAGSPFELIARDLAAISIFRDGPVMVCDAAQFETSHLIEVLAPTLLSRDAGTLIITGVESLSLAQQKILESLMTSRDMCLPFARRFRLALAAAGVLSDLADSGHFGETLYYKISSLSVEVPSLDELRSDILLHARQLLDQHCAARKSLPSPAFTTDAATWLEGQEWAGNYTELSRTLLLAVTHSNGPELDVAALESALEQTIVESESLTAPKPATPVPAPVRAPAVIEETLPPFSMRAAPPPVVAIPLPAPVAPPMVTSVTITHTEAAPTQSAPARIPTPARAPSGLTGRSLFRPVAGTYDFSKRLAESLALAESTSAS
jgi:DNA-binding NtrC family response regulator